MNESFTFLWLKKCRCSGLRRACSAPEAAGLGHLTVGEPGHRIDGGAHGFWRQDTNLQDSGASTYFAE